MTEIALTQEKNQTIGKNRTRQVELDLAKALAIIFMVFVHVYEAHWYLENSEEGAGYICAWLIEFLGGVPAAPLFMLAMGVGVVYSKRSTAATYLKRAAQIFGLGILVNFFQQWVPIFLRPDAAEEFAANAHSIIATDIYSFVAVTFLFFAFLKTTKHPVAVTTITMIVCLIVSEITYPNSIATGSVWLDSIIGIFIRTNEYSYFPFFTWALWPLLGYLFGRLLMKTENKLRLYSILAAVGVAALAVSTFVINMDPNDIIINSLTEANMEDVGLYYAMDTWNLLWSFGALAIEMFVLYLAVRLSRNRIPALFSYMSRHIMSIYVIQWVFIGLATPIFDRVTDVFVCAVLGGVILALTLVSAWLWDKLMTRRRENQKNKVSAA